MFRPFASDDAEFCPSTRLRVVSLSNHFGFEFCNLEFICDLSFVICDLKSSFWKRKNDYINPGFVNGVMDTD